jgi:hypothetical protein
MAADDAGTEDTQGTHVRDGERGRRRENKQLY